MVLTVGLDPVPTKQFRIYIPVSNSIFVFLLNLLNWKMEKAFLNFTKG